MIYANADFDLSIKLLFVNWKKKIIHTYAIQSSYVMFVSNMSNWQNGCMTSKFASYENIKW